MRFRIADLFVVLLLVAGATTTIWGLYLRSTQTGHTKVEYAWNDINAVLTPMLFALSERNWGNQDIVQLNDNANRWLEGRTKELFGTELVDKASKDPWGRPFRCMLSRSGEKIDIDIVSSGQDGRLGNGDDIRSDMKSIPVIYCLAEFGFEFWVGISVSVFAITAILGRTVLRRKRIMN